MLKLIAVLVLVTACAHKPKIAPPEQFAECSMTQINLAVENWQNHPGPMEFALTSEQLLHHMLMRCYRDEIK